LKVKVDPRGGLVKIHTTKGIAAFQRIEKSPYYKFAKSGRVWPLLRYIEMYLSRDSMEALVNLAWTVALLEKIKREGFCPEMYLDWPLWRGRVVQDGHRRTAFCAALEIPIEVENTLQDAYIQWNQAFQVGDGWLDVTEPPDWRIHPEMRRLCYKTWDLINSLVNFEDRSVVDLGCAQGFYCHRAIDAGATDVTGIDRDDVITQPSNAGLPRQHIVNQAIQVAWVCGYCGKINFVVADLATWKPPRQWDIVLALRIHYHFGRFQNDFLSRASRAAKEALVLQTNLVHKGMLAQYCALVYAKIVLHYFWKHVEMVPNGRRPLLICKERRKWTS